jgi:hypothetical protein
MDQHIIQWAGPSPLWKELIANGSTRPVEGFGAPAILRFATDDFMQKYQDTLSTDPLKLGEFRAVPETWRGAVAQPAVPTPARSFALSFQRRGSINTRTSSTGAKATSSTDAAELPRLKLYQPAHQRYYLISACLVCASPGLPDRKVDAGKQEKISFVMRRLIKPTSNSSDVTQWDEYAWVDSGTGYVWQKVRAGDVTSDAVSVINEERLPLFATTFQEDDLRSRRLVSGIIPVAKREAYLGAQSRASADDSATSGTTAITARKILLRKQVIEPWKAIVNQAATAAAAIDENVEGNVLTDNEIRDARRTTREQVQVLSWLVLLDLAEFLQSQIPELWTAILSGQRPAAGATRDAYDILDAAALDPDDDKGLRDAIQHHESVPVPENGDPDPRDEIYADEDVPDSLLDALARYGEGSDEIKTTLKEQLESVDEPYLRSDAQSRGLWPDFVFPLADPEFPTQVPLPLAADLPSISLTAEELADLELNTEEPLTADPLDEFAVALARALPNDAAGPEPAIPTAALTPADQLNAVFRIRCIYERPNCGPLHEDVVSDPTELFDLASFFDPDAPARPIRIGLPLDTTPAGLRKFDKNSAFVMSDILCGQMARLKGITFGDLIRAVLPWPLHKDLSVPDAGPCIGGGTICSLSIPIITLCAFILLIIFVTLLNIVFGWLPFFKICFPIPGLKGKQT